ncbi:uncharacterized protein C9orf57 homolog isoform X1 [Pteropus medius]|uniref:uncharacterized protein C9orf57 homolog isoform X1 n=1 Tax=Pteropus vampyrus TaxID=132908 RepID=UPI00196AF592|nr:uncharacterized protein C9orf57 homolog isoform X1 [Pteropus giganteus]
MAEANQQQNIGGAASTEHRCLLPWRKENQTLPNLLILQGEARNSVLGNNKTVICRSCNLSIPFHGCLLDFGVCVTKPGQYCIKEVHHKDGIHWFSVKGCTESHNECFKRIVKYYKLYSTHCCHRTLCNI